MFHSVRPLPHTPGTYGVPPRQFKTGRGKGDPHFNMQLKFGDELCGRLIYEDNQLKFIGSFKTAGRIFAEFVWNKFQEWYYEADDTHNHPIRDRFDRINAQFANGIVDGQPIFFRKGPPFNLTLDLDGMTIGKFWYEGKRLKFEGDADESAEMWVGWVIEKFQEWHDENIR